MVTGDGARFELTVERDFNRLRWSPDVTTISAKDVQATADAFETVLGPDRRPLLVHVGALGGITPEARQMLLEGTHPTRVAILTEDLVTKVITAFAYAAVRPTRLFSDETEATRWLLNAHPGPKPGPETDAGADAK